MLDKIGIGILTKIVPAFLKEHWGWLKKKYQESKNASHDYPKHYKERHGQLKISCLEMQAPISLEKVYVAVHLLDQERATQYGSLENIETEFRERTNTDSESSSDERQYGMIVANDEQYLMVLGGPGVGKSTFLRKVGLEALKRKNGNFQHECTPVFLELKRFTENSIDIEALITHEFRVCGYPYPEQMMKTTLESDKLLLLLDGLDEVPKEIVNKAVDKIGDFVNQYSQNRFIASCRKAENIRGFTQFTNVEIADFDDSQIKRCINNWFPSTSNESLQEPDDEITTADLCWEALNMPYHQAIKELVRNPLLLALLCVVYEHSQDLPRNRSEFYEKAVHIFLKKWPDEKYVSRDLSVSQYLNVGDEEDLLSEIAAKNFEEDRLLFTEKELIDQIKEFSEQNSITLSNVETRKVLEAITVEQGFFVERASGVFTFLHLTFQEYLTANYFASTQPIQRLVTDHLHDKRWREVFLFAAELLPESDSLLIAMEVETAKSINTDGLKALIRWVGRITTASDNLYSELAKRAFAIRQYFFLRIFNKIHETVNCETRQSRNYVLNFEYYLDRNFWQDLLLYENIYPYLYLDFYHDLYQDLDLDLYLYQDLYRDLQLNCYLELYLDTYRELYRDFVNYLYLNHDQALFLYHDFYRYMDRNFLSSVFSKFGDRLDRELSGRIELVERVEQMKIFNEVDLQRMVKQFKAQWEYIEASGKGKSVESPAESIHDTWLSVLGITDEMLSISHEEMENYIQYLRAVELIIECKEATGRVSPEVWQKIEDRLLAWDAEEVRN